MTATCAPNAAGSGWRRRSASWCGCACRAGRCRRRNGWPPRGGAGARQRHDPPDHAQTIQFHGILKGNLRPLIQGLHTEMLDTIAACGDVNRNVIATVDPWRRRARAVATLASDIAASAAAHPCLARNLDRRGTRRRRREEDEPIYGRTYLPRKFKIGVALPPHNDVDVFAQDLGFMAIEQGRKIVGYNVTVGGGMGMTHGEPETYPRAGDVIGFCDRPGGRGGRGRRDDAARPRRPVESQAGAAEIHHRPDGSGRVRRGGRTRGSA